MRSSSRPLPHNLVRPGNFFFRYRDFLFPAVFVVLIAATRPLLLFGSPRWDFALDAAGVIVALGGQLLRAAVIGFAYIRRGGKNKTVYADSLVQEGFFAHSRNPLYLGNYLAMLGFFLIHNSVLGYLLGIPFFTFAYLAITAAEEDFLRAKFGPEYEDYCRRVNRFWPSPSGISETVSSMRFDWKRLVRKEYGSTFAGITCILVLLLWEGYRQLGPPALASRGAVLAIVWIPVVVLYLAAFYLKKSGALGTG